MNALVVPGFTGKLRDLSFSDSGRLLLPLALGTDYHTLSGSKYPTKSRVLDPERHSVYVGVTMPSGSKYPSRSRVSGPKRHSEYGL